MPLAKLTHSQYQPVFLKLPITSIYLQSLCRAYKSRLLTIETESEFIFVKAKAAEARGSWKFPNQHESAHFLELYSAVYILLLDDLPNLYEPMNYSSKQ